MLNSTVTTLSNDITYRLCFDDIFAIFRRIHSTILKYMNTSNKIRYETRTEVVKLVCSGGNVGADEKHNLCFQSVVTEFL